MASITKKWVRHLRNRDRQEKEKLESLVACGHPSCSSKCRSELEDKDNCRPQHIERPQQVPPPPVNNRISLVSKVNTVYSRLVNVEEVCTQIGQGQPRNSERNPDLNLEQWVALQAIHRTLLHEHNELPVTFSPISPELRHLRKIAHDHSLQSRSLRRFSDCLLPLLKREQDLESARQWLELMKSSSSLLEILGKNDLLVTYEEMTLMNLIDQIEAILERLKQWFRCRYEDLSRKKDVTEEQGLSEPIFEFPNNIRHTCTTMPWTIFPALLVLWGVCWMFIIGSSQPEPEWGNATDPTISPLPAAYDFHADFYGIGIEEGPQRSVADSSDNRPYVNQDTLEELFPGDGQSMSDLIHPLTFVGDIPLDPNFLITDMTSHSDSGNMELAAQDTAEILPAAAMEDSTLRACISAGDSGERDDTGSADSSGYGHPTINSDEAGETKSRFVCPDCQRTFARPFTLSRHRTERHNHPSSLEAALLCPNRGCKRSKGKPFKREFHLKRHLESCNHSQEDLGQGDDQSCPRPASTSTSASASIHHRQEVGPDKAIRTNDMKRPRVEDDEGSNDGFLLAEMVKKYKKIEKEIEEKEKEIEEKKTEIEEKEKENLQKQDDLKALGKTIQMLERS